MGGLRSDAVSPVPYRGAMKVPPVALGALALALAPIASASTPADHHGEAPGGVGVRRAAVDGREEIARLGCAACHGDLQPAGQRLAPDLGLAAERLRPDFLLRYLADPLEAQPGTRMPDLMADRTPGERAEVARALAAFLASEAPATDGASAGGSGEAARDGDPKRGDRIYHEVGCVMCHGERRGGAPLPEGGRSLDHVAGKYTADGLAAFLHEPLAHRPGGLMPDMHLNRGEAADLAAYLIPSEGAGTGGEPLPGEAALVGAGREHFRTLRCAACHGDVGGVEAPLPFPAGPLGAGCASKAPPAGLPVYDLSDGQRAALVEAAGQLGEPRAPEVELASTMAALRCTACHERDGVGGVPAALDGFLTTDEPDLGEPARRPPTLSGVGAKLRREWLERVLHDGASVRPYMHTRMPVFGDANVADLPGHLEALDAEEPLVFPRPEGEQWKEAREAARTMLGTTGLGCVSCHQFNTKDAPGFQGVDLITTPERLRERWFRDFMVKPTSKVADIVMPESWPGGEPVYDTLLGADTDRQLGAIWHYLALGRSARNPKGIDQPRWDVNVEGRARLYRGRSRIAGFRGVAVGFEEGLNYAFDANNGALAGLWRGDFVSVNWNGQGAGDFNPRGRPVELPRDLAFAPGEGPPDPWPVRPVMTEENPVNPDPTYPRQHGYRFRGYHLDGDGVPTLRYSIGAVDVEDRTVPVKDGERTVLRRSITFDAPEAGPMVFRALAGLVEVPDSGGFVFGKLRLTLAPLSPLKPKMFELRSVESGSELLLHLPLPAGPSTLELTYDLAD